jgi:predicted hotdog family 3-hydroxylacyl-ACP dehydratase
MAAIELGIEALIPHRGPMRLVERIVTADDHQAVTEARVAATWPLRTAEGVAALVLVELAAQTAGVLIGRRERLRREALTEGAGWLVGIREARLHVDELLLGSVVRTQVQAAYTYETYTQVSARATVANRPVGDIVLQVFWAPGA